MSFFTCPHCNHEIDIFSRGGAENMAKHLACRFWAALSLTLRCGSLGTAASPSCLEGENSPHAKSIFAFARKVAARVAEIKAGESASVISIQ
jgi:ATP-binding protein involved in chromosome partitioning